MNGHEQISDEELQAPPRLMKALADLEKERVFVPASVDEAILKQAREHLAHGQTPSLVRLPWAAWMGLAACLAIVAWLFKSAPSRLEPPQSLTQITREDVNGDGQVDILDALALARQVEQGHKLDKQLDLNGDGVVDRRDAEAIARQVVKLTKGGRS